MNTKNIILKKGDQFKKITPNTIMIVKQIWNMFLKYKVFRYMYKADTHAHTGFNNSINILWLIL